MNIQKLVSENVKARGYYEGHEPVPLLARHVAKAQEELSEVGYHVVFDGDNKLLELECNLIDSGSTAKDAFDNGDWSWVEDLNPQKVKEELADLQVVILSMAQVISDNFGEFDVLEAALAKSQKDIERGVR